MKTNSNHLDEIFRNACLSTRSEEVAREDEIVSKALKILESRLRKRGNIAECKNDVLCYLKLKMMVLEHEVFYLIYLDIKNGIIAHEQHSRGTVSHCSIYPREVVKEALRYNATGIILVHNHPSGLCLPSNDDLKLTRLLSVALRLVDCTIHDHIIVAGNESYSMQEKGDLYNLTNK